MLRKKTILIIFIILNAIVFTGTYLQMRKFGTLPQTMSSTVPDFSWQDFGGKTHNIKELSGHTVVIHFWATWCGPCRRELPDLLAAAKKLDKDVIFLTISDDDTLEAAQQFMKKMLETTGSDKPGNVLYAFDPDKKIAVDLFQTSGFPESIIVDKTGNMRQKFAGAVHWENEEVVEKLKTF